jgi:replication factor C subunit 3/5
MQLISIHLQSICHKENLQLPNDLAQRIAEKSERNLRRAILMLEACKVQKYPFTKTQDVPEIDWQRFLNETGVQILAEQSPAKLEQVRDRLYELLSQGIPPDVIFKGLVQVLTKNCDIEIKAEILSFASLYEYRMQLGSKQIFHLEAFVAHFMSVYKKFNSDLLMDIDD